MDPGHPVMLSAHLKSTVAEGGRKKEKIDSLLFITSSALGGKKTGLRVAPEESNTPDPLLLL